MCFNKSHGFTLADGMMPNSSVSLCILCFGMSPVAGVACGSTVRPMYCSLLYCCGSSSLSPDCPMD